MNLTVTAGDPVNMLEEPVSVPWRALQRAGMTLDEIDLFAVNEALRRSRWHGCRRSVPI